MFKYCPQLWNRAGIASLHEQEQLQLTMDHDNNIEMAFTLSNVRNSSAFLSCGFAARRRFENRRNQSPRTLFRMTTNSTHVSDPRTLRVVASRRAFLSFSLAAALQAAFSRECRAAAKGTTSAYDIEVKKNGSPMKLSEYGGKVTLFVNVATHCALTPQYEGLVELHDTFQPQGFEIVAAPCDQFGHQEPGSNEDICKFAKEQFGAKFLLLDKLNVNDAPGGVAPLYKFLKDTSPEGTGQRVSWNFEKFLVGPDGTVLRRYKPGILPEQIRNDVEWAVKHPGADLPPKKKPYLGVE